MKREEKILFNIRPQYQIGLEFGPLTSPIVTRSMGSVRYVDHVSTEELKKKCAPWRTIDLSKIVDVDYVWTNENLKELTSKECPFDYVIASHVVEHVPDFVGWCKEIRSVLKTGGILSMAVPDKRFTFDYLRQLTRLSDVLEAYLLKSKKPAARHIFDYKAGYVNRFKKFKWNCREILIHEHTIQEAWEITQNAVLNNSYEDVHCWVFTELSFLKLLKTLMCLDLFDYKVVKFFNTTGIEFFVSLEAMDLNISKSERKLLQLDSINNAQKKITELFQQPAFNYKSWKVVNILRLIKKKFVIN